jgi:hypothetical protein
MSKYITAIGKVRVANADGEIRIVRPGDLVDADSAEGKALIEAGLAIETAAAPSPTEPADTTQKKARKTKAE